MKLKDSGISTFSLACPPINITEELSRFHIDKANLKPFHVRTVLRSIKRSVVYLADKHNCNQTDIYRVALRHGVSYLYSLPEIRQLKLVYLYVLKNTTDPEDRRVLESRFFDLNDKEQKSNFSGEFPIQELSQIGSISSDLGITKSAVFQLALIPSLLRTQELLPDLHDKLSEVFLDFREYLSRWMRRAMEIKRLCNGKTGDKRDPKYSLEEVLL